MMQWPPWKSAPRPEPVDVQALAREVARETVEQVTEQLNRAAFESPLSSVGGKAPGIYAFDQPWQYYTPQAPVRRPGSYVTVDTLRRLADGYDILRACIQHHKREVAAVAGGPSPRDAKDKSKGTQRAVEEANAFFGVDGGLGGAGRRRTHFESEILEDVLVVGAAAVFFNGTRGGGLYDAVAVDAATIRPRTDAYGWPGPGEIAYEQWIYGVQVGEGYTREQLLYDGLNPISYSPYFKSPIEWLVNVVNGALRADAWNLAWLTDGNTPGDIIALPEDWTPDQILTYAQYWDGMQSGNSRQRQKTRFVPSGTQRVGALSRKDQDFQEFELWLMRRTCGVMGVAPAAIGFAGEQYKVSQEGAMDSASQIGSGQLLEFRKHLYDEVLRKLGFDFLEWVDATDQEEDAKTLAETNEILIRSGQRTPNECRVKDGEKGISGGDTLFVLNTLVPLEQAIKPPEPPPSANGAPAAQDDQEGASGGDGASPDSAQRVADLRTWKTKALKRVKDGKPALCSFESEALGPYVIDDIRFQLARCEDADAVRAVFAEAGRC